MNKVYIVFHHFLHEDHVVRKVFANVSDALFYIEKEERSLPNKSRVYKEQWLDFEEHETE